MHAAFPITVASVATVAYAVFAVWTELSRKRAATLLSVASATIPSGGGSAIGPLVIIIGLGGVGSHTANLLLRGGVRRLRLIDFDQVTLSSLNRNATAVRADVGTPKVVALREQMLRVAPSAQIEAIVALFDAAAAPRLLAGEPALVVDCIDDLATKAALLGYCVREGLPVLCALGAGGKGDCCAFHVGRLSEVFNDPIAASLLKRLKKQRVDGTDDEAPTTAPVGLLPLPSGATANELGSQASFRVRVMPVLPPLPAAMGAALAAHSLSVLAGNPVVPSPRAVPSMSAGFQTRLYRAFLKRELKEKQRPASEVPLTYHEVALVVNDIFRSRSALSGTRLLDPTRPVFCLCRFDERCPADVSNVLFVTVKEAARHEREGIEALPSDLRRHVERTIEEGLAGRPCSLLEEARRRGREGASTS